MNKDASDFMIQEYDQIAGAYYGLRDQINDWFKTYISLIGLPLTVLAAAVKLTQTQSPISITDLPDVVAALLIMVSILGFFVALSIVAMRMEMILYARTINGIRRYFAELDQKTGAGTRNRELVEYLILPTSDSMPPFFESWRAMFWQVIIIGLIDAIILMVAVQSLVRVGWGLSFGIGLIYGASHLGVYALMANIRRKQWHVRFPENMKSSEY